MPLEAPGLAPRLRALFVALEGGEAVPEGALTLLLEEVGERAAELGRAELEEVAVEVDRLIQHVGLIRSALAGELEQVAERRSGIQGYNRLRTITERQRLSRRA